VNALAAPNQLGLLPLPTAGRACDDPARCAQRGGVQVRAPGKEGAGGRLGAREKGASGFAGSRAPVAWITIALDRRSGPGAGWGGLVKADRRPGW